jgi:SAM-dependent methyltransferase
MSPQAIYEHKVYSNAGNLALLAHVPAGARSVLDIGCGAGDNARVLRDRGLKIWAVTLSQVEAVRAREFCEDVLIANVEADDLALPLGFFDVLLLSHVLEHLVAPQSMLTRAARFLAPKGLVLVAVPNAANYRDRWRLLRGNWRMEETGTFDRTHLHFWSYDTADEIFAGTPLRIQKKLPGDPALPLWPARRLLPRKLLQGVDAWGGRMIPNFCAGQVILIAAHAVSE